MHLNHVYTQNCQEFDIPYVHVPSDLVVQHLYDVYLHNEPIAVVFSCWNLEFYLR